LANVIHSHSLKKTMNKKQGAIVTGSTSGIGLAIAQALAGAGTRVRDAARASLKPNHLPFLRSRASAVPVRALNVRRHVRQR
jgi:NAD(P)-dependent dehydrogenase (short-subunit alcohol dehydrogenase family)